MRRQDAEKRLADLGFEIDWQCTGPSEDGYVGTIDAVGRMSIDGDCRGEVVRGDSAPDFYRAAVAAAEGYRSKLTLCGDTTCDFHNDRSQ